MVGIYGGKGHALTVDFARIHPLVGLEDAIVRMVVSDFDAMSAGVSFEYSFPFHRFLRCRRLLKVDESQSAVLVNVDSRIAVPFGGQKSIHLGD